jgi:hypothetical protein
MTYVDKWASGPRFHTVAFFHGRVAKLFAERVARSGRSWEDAVYDPELALTKSDFEAVEAELLATGYRFDSSAGVSLAESSDKYKPVAARGTGDPLEIDADGRPIVGRGDNVFHTAVDLIGTVRFIGDTDTVMDMLADGVPANTVAAIDDAGGTLTAPILQEFVGVLCKGGTVRSHLGILTREYRIPCLMAVELKGLQDGDTVRIESSAPAHSPYDTDCTAARARVWKTIAEGA